MSLLFPLLVREEGRHIQYRLTKMVSANVLLHFVIIVMCYIGKVQNLVLTTHEFSGKMQRKMENFALICSHLRFYVDLFFFK